MKSESAERRGEEKRASGKQIGWALSSGVVAGFSESAPGHKARQCLEFQRAWGVCVGEGLRTSRPVLATAAVRDKLQVLIVGCFFVVAG